MSQSADTSYAIAPGWFGSSFETGIFSSYDRAKIVEWGILTFKMLSRQIFRAFSTIAGEWFVVDRYMVNSIRSSWWERENLFHIIRCTWLIRSATPSTAILSAEAGMRIKSAAAK